MIRANWLVPCAMLFALASVAPAPLKAAEAQTSPEQAAKFVTQLGNRAVTLLAEYPSGNAHQLQMQLRDFIHQSFDLELISRFVLGATWQTATPAQRPEYSSSGRSG